MLRSAFLPLRPAARPSGHETRGLCGACGRAEVCTLRKAEFPVLDCAEFLLAEPAPRNRSTRREARIETRPAVMPQGSLCDICGQWATCDYPRPAGGSWRCEEGE